MGRLAGYKYREIVKILKKSGFEFRRQADGSHEIWYNPNTNRYTTIPNHPGDMPEGTLRAILKQAGIDIIAFLNKNNRSRTNH
jgi:predicted RNA binding protein YcfA (HicA-like mRNA interferase family)